MKMSSCRIKPGFLLLALMFPAASAALAANIGTVASFAPTSITVGDPGSQITFTVSNFQLPLSISGGGGIQYDPADISIDFSAAPGSATALTFSSNATGPAPGTTFFANFGQTSNFRITYDLTIAPTLPGTGTVSFVSLTNSFTTSNAGNGFGSLQTIVIDTNGIGTSSLLNSNTLDTNTVSISDKLPSITTGELFNLSGGNINPGNISVLNFQSAYTAVFRPIPEPSSLAFLGVALAASAQRRRRPITPPPWA